ncbi:23S ribosomal RNA methyltransferase Erm [Virgibacillus salexigens]|uniref:rRNA adenine N-6-methyltransferase n=1 Tax=Virgibacillus massiliensis TaxID=1462526 RepID=A0A024QH23_9BACI|nr:23S ribosomal RNA methyltransferase Erm [Virgibacillus massiliensis]CDQ41266.1 rRNA adenine N-6-methyltransferase [Virgibacillus massiliensis]
MTKRIHKYGRKKLSNGEPPNYLGQHLLHHKPIINEMVKQANISKEDSVLELGAGEGALTTILSKKARRVIAVEYDQRFVSILKEKTKNGSNTKNIHEDILKIQLPSQNFIVVSSIPYAITTPIMKLLLNHPSSAFQRGVLVIEKGAAKRFPSKFIKDAYVLIWRMWFTISYYKDISRYHFSPPPSVDSAMLVIIRKKESFLSTNDYLAFYGLAEYALRRPELEFQMVLRPIFTPPQIKHLKRNLGIHKETPIGLLTELQWSILFTTMKQYVARPLWPKPSKRKSKRGAYHDKKQKNKKR